MRRLIRILAGTALVGAFVFVASPPASADHDSPAGTEWPCTSGDGLDPPLPNGCDGDAYHEEMPNIAVVEPNDVCVVQGGILADPATVGGPQHVPAIPLVNEDPAHSHYAFVGESSINCLFGGVLTVESDGGNDGHMIDLFDPVSPLGGANGDLLEVDPVTSNAAQHDFNDHHGSVNESAWSTSSLYSAGPGGGPSNACGTIGTTTNDNKADITAVTAAGTSLGWLKYIRVGVVVDVWGCFYAGPLAGTHFFSLIALLANPADPGGAFDLVGVAALGSGWLCDTEVGGSCP